MVTLISDRNNKLIQKLNINKKDFSYMEQQNKELNAELMGKLKELLYLKGMLIEAKT